MGLFSLPSNNFWDIFDWINIKEQDFKMSQIHEFFKGIKEGNKKFGENISIIPNSFFISLVFFFGVGIPSVLSKLVKKSFLDLKIKKTKTTYWSNINLNKKSLDDYYKQF